MRVCFLSLSHAMHNSHSDNLASCDLNVGCSVIARIEDGAMSKRVCSAEQNPCIL